MNLLGRLHGQHVHTRRVAVLARHLAPLLPQSARVLDVGCGDGQLAARLHALRPDVHIEGVDVLVREHTAIPVRSFDGARIPLADASIDLVLMVDVLHHTENPAVLLAEAARVARGGVLLKEHLCEGPAARLTLRAMDWVGNARHGVHLPYNYWSRAQWTGAFAQLGLVVQHWQSALHLYPRPAGWLFDRALHFVALLAVSRSGVAGRSPLLAAS
ncbi:MAG TPA: class I SAM-dependent methyltransferase [Gemmatimonadaceae bacterium]|nr:class I SAM-dependent methyltransferase [Gemmatimonadaceae bacterium]